MNLLQLVLKQMRQRLLSTLLTTLSIFLGIALATGINVVSREGRNAFAQTDYGYDLIVGPKSSPMQLVLNTVYNLDKSPGTLPYTLFEELTNTTPATTSPPPHLAVALGRPFRGRVRWAVPYAVGDSLRGYPIIGTSPSLFGVDDTGRPLPDPPEYREGRRYTFAQGHPFAPNRFDAALGSDVAQRLHLKLGDTFHATHGMPNPGDIPDVHAETWTVTGILAETHTAADRSVFIPLQSFYAITEHEETLQKIAGMDAPATTPATQPAHHDDDEKAYTLHPDGTFTLTLPKDEWRVSAILLKATSPSSLLDLQFVFRNRTDALAVSPAVTMQQFFDTFLPATAALLLLISLLVTLVAGIGILVSIYNSVTSRYREIAILRALGATRARILSAVCLEGLLIGAIGSTLGLLGGHAVAFAASLYLDQTLGIPLAWHHPAPSELLYLPLALAISFAASLTPALKAYRTPVADNLT